MILSGVTLTKALDPPIITIVASAPSFTTSMSGYPGGLVASTAPVATTTITAVQSNVGVITASLPTPVAVLVGGPQNIAATAPSATSSITMLVGVAASISSVLTSPSTAIAAAKGEVATLAGTAPVAIGTVSGTQTTAAAVTAKAPSATAVMTAYITITGRIAAAAPSATADLSGGTGFVTTIVAALPLPTASFSVTQILDTLVSEVVVNSITGAVTEYDNYGFDSFATISGTHYAAGVDGIYELDSGGTDDGAAISASFETGALSFKSEYLKRLESVYAAYRTSGDILISVRTDEGKQYTYSMKWDKVSTVKQRRVPVGKGLKGKYWQFKVENVNGASFGFDTFNILAHETVRRIGV